jgi:hypothetical protein
MEGREWYHPFDSPEISGLTNTWNNLPVARATATAVIMLAVIAFALSRPRFGRPAIAALAAVLVINLGIMEVVNRKSVGPQAAAEYATAPRLVRDVKVTRDDVVVSSVRVALGARLNHQREIYWTDVPEFDHLFATPPADATVLIMPWQSRNQDEWDGEPLGWRRVGADPVHEWAVWVRDTDPRAVR